MPSSSKNDDPALGGIAGVVGDALARYASVMEQISRIWLDALHETREIEQKIQAVVLRLGQHFLIPE